MGLRMKSVSELQNELETGDINKITIPECSYLSLSNNYHISLAMLLAKYQSSKEDFFILLEQQHNDILKQISEKSDDSYKNLSDIEIADKIFDENADLQYILIAAEKSVERIYKLLKHEKDCFDTEYYEGLIYLFGNIIFDINTLSSSCHRRTEQDVKLGIFKLSKDLLRNYCMPSLPVIPTTIFLIRQTIELSIKHLFKFVSMNYQNTEDEVIVPISKFLEFLLKNENNLICPIPMSLLIKINSWSNYYIHTGNFRQMYWEVEWAHYILNDFVYDGIKFKESYLNNYKKEFEKYLKKKYNPIEIKWR